MAMGKRPAARQGSPLWVTTADLPTNAGHPFFERLNRVLDEAGFDAFVEGLCAVFYAPRMGAAESASWAVFPDAVHERLSRPTPPEDGRDAAGEACCAAGSANRLLPRPDMVPHDGTVAPRVHSGAARQRAWCDVRHRERLGEWEAGPQPARGETDCPNGH